MERTFHGEAITGYQPFDVKSFAEIAEEPSYFKKESRQSQEMSFEELSRYIRDLSQSGFEPSTARSTESQAGISTGHAGNGNSGGSVRALHGRAVSLQALRWRSVLRLHIGWLPELLMPWGTRTCFRQ